MVRPRVCLVIFVFCRCLYLACPSPPHATTEKRIKRYLDIEVGQLSTEDEALLEKRENQTTADDMLSFEEQESYKEDDNEDDEQAGQRKLRRRKRFTNNGHGGDLLDKPNNDPDSEIGRLLESMFSKHGGVEHTPNIDISNSATARGMLLDQHRYTQRQKVMFGMESENPASLLQKRKKRNFIYDPRSVWRYGIVPYAIDPSFSQKSKRLIQAAINLMSTVTCVRFLPVGSAGTSHIGHSNYVHFVRSSACYSYIGMIGMGRQEVGLMEPNCIHYPIILHEMCHALGMEHEQSRSDRDRYVEMLWNNIWNSYNNRGMQMIHTRNRNPYDYSSVLQYNLFVRLATEGIRNVIHQHQRAYALNRNMPSMRLKDPKLNFLTNSAYSLSFYDIKDITDQYKPQCGITCPSNFRCLHGGFLNHQCNCHCPDGLTGDRCESTVTEPGCGGVMHLEKGETKYILSPNYPNVYTTGKNCYWVIKSSIGSYIRVIFEDFNVSRTSTYCYHWLEVRYNLIGQQGPRLCGDRNGDVYTTTPEGLYNHMYLKFNNAFAKYKPASRGFKLKVIASGTPCAFGPCKYGNCSETLTNYKCTCEPGFGGKDCDELWDGAKNLYADFDSNTLSFMTNVNNIDNFDWELNAGGTTSYGTGPNFAYSGQRYMYAEGSTMRAPWDTAILVSNNVKLKALTPRCFRFHFYMYGVGMGRLNVYTFDPVYQRTLLWYKSGNHGEQWLKAEVDIPSRADIQIILEAVRGINWASDIAIDSLELLSGRCSDITTTSTTTTPAVTTTKTPTTTETTTTSTTSFKPMIIKTTTASTTSSTIKASTTSLTTSSISITTSTNMNSEDVKAKCTFEDGNGCFLRNVGVGRRNLVDDSLRYSHLDWILGKSGSTPSRGTGPDSAYSGDKYAYLEASSPTRNGDKALLVSTQTFDDSKGHCISFAYHMFGLDGGVGSLNIYSTSTNGEKQRIFSTFGNLGNKWFHHSVEIPATTGLKIYIEGKKGRTFRSDIAIDDITVKEGTCGCAVNPCNNGGVCSQDDNDKVTCVCLQGYGGQTCDEIVGTVTCSFEPGKDCAFLWQSTKDDHDWSFGTRTPSSRTGPQTPYLGTFAYIEASRRRQGERFTFTTEGSKLKQQKWCLSFAYNMYGMNVGQLSVKSGSPGSLLQIWSVSGNKGSEWLTANVDIPSTPNLVIEIEATRGGSYRGDIAIDETSLKSGNCT